jgi:hypothetical protein
LLCFDAFIAFTGHIHSQISYLLPFHCLTWNWQKMIKLTNFLSSICMSKHVIVVFWIWLISLNIIYSCSINFSTGKIFLLWGCIILHCMYRPSFFTHQSTDDHLGWFYVLNLDNTATINMAKQESFHHGNLISLWHILRSGPHGTYIFSFLSNVHIIPILSYFPVPTTVYEHSFFSTSFLSY